ncbi:Response regulator receiver modulated metal dependent phosphohydrolase [Desulfamplus magnetovallimortis]|uniref:Response regulator receiver modulated metal dependent phosphohydrolase n=1 Tax=Desulfamplus magnetovallimortis TaxID=1246637 RepID=A0A1W1HKB1_9BACT|nr:HD domain-containing phosphohydrolase [Desulfamplus magnetovallimortis]SLM32914.1 Response regulator receiver modulated metal dependent phosphohydrolase [Desulfamplus magnetovallimortis]
MNKDSETKTILIVDDVPENIDLLADILNTKYITKAAISGEKALKILKSGAKIDLALLDINMPSMDGYELCMRIKKDTKLQRIPVIFITASNENQDEIKGFDVGGVDYITKPVNPAIVLRRVKTHLSLVHMDELQKTSLLVIQQLGKAAEFKDNETGLHVIRMSHYSRIIAEKLSNAHEWTNLVFRASPMHDVGKIGVPDNILLKPGPLNDNEWKIMRRHPRMGYQIIGGHDSKLLKLASEIALSHHEKWNGTGYPGGLKGDEIPLSGRIVAIADVFDALTTKRPYKEAWAVERAIDHIKKESGSHFDPELVPLFLSSMGEVLAVRDQWGEPETKAE